MAIVAAAMVLPLGLLFIVSGLIVNLVQAILFVLVWPISKNTYRKINKSVVEMLWLQLVWLIDWRGGVKVKLFTDPETFRLMGKEHALLICNHKSDIDWLVGWVLAERSACLGNALAVMKKSLKFLPVYGWSMWFSEYLFLERSWAKDENTLKGFVSAVSHMRTFVPAIYDSTVAIPRTEPAPTMLRLLKGQPSVVHVHIKRHLMKELPETEDAVAQWCRDIFVAKDELLDKHAAEGTFDDQEHDIGRPIKSLLVVIFWSCVLTLGALKFLQWSSLLSSWKGITFSAVGLGIVTFFMHILIVSSQSEHSTNPKVAPTKSRNGEGLSKTGQSKKH
ncbi:1-acyl-sn-glycerol-3-phosphate acyltransferase 2 isoform X2 [Malania oleifera]|uniref:1-acyl-sn-glycerol-3-phosphate acyltransferase 2 isoform X2 n=1 Tax=Malania oleifera TaxID=397392 RepID=UPI0025AEC599|nr:1-acyl-sn-glycerol-3-phosphate acyltransferase 2 isoform X2 [Malania oleifera]